jgi:hypothetical protein
MKTGKELIIANMQTHNCNMWEIINTNGKAIAAQLKDISHGKAAEMFEETLETLPTGKYTCVIGKESDIKGMRVKRGVNGSGVFSDLPLIVSAQHVDINSHNATAHHTNNFITFEQHMAVVKELEAVKLDKLKLEIENERLKSEEGGGINGLLNSQAGQGLMLALANMFNGNQQQAAAINGIEAPESEIKQKVFSLFCRIAKTDKNALVNLNKLATLAESQPEKYFLALKFL